MNVSTETNKTPAGEMYWIVLQDADGKTLGNLGLIDFRSPKLRYEIQRDICEFLRGRQAPAPMPTPSVDSARLCPCGAALGKRARYCKDCRKKTRKKADKLQKQKQRKQAG